MLVVSRKRNEAIVIGDGIEVRVLRSGRDGVRLGITAPAHVTVYRSELYEQIKTANTIAAGVSGQRELVQQLRRRITDRVAEYPRRRSTDTAAGEP